MRSKSAMASTLARSSRKQASTQMKTEEKTGSTTGSIDRPIHSKRCSDLQSHCSCFLTRDRFYIDPTAHSKSCWSTRQREATKTRRCAYTTTTAVHARTSQKNSLPLSETNHEIQLLSSSDAESSLRHRDRHMAREGIGVLGCC